MADGLSLVASIIAVIGAAEGVMRTFSRIKSIGHAPDELLALMNEVSDLQIILDDVQSYIRNSQRPQMSQKHLQHLSLFIDRAKVKLLELDELIYYRVLKPEGSLKNIKLSKKEWLKAVETIDRFRKALRDIRLNIVTHMMTINSTYQSRIGLTVDEIHIATSRLRSEYQSSFNLMRSQLEEHAKVLNEITQSQAGIQDLLLSQQECRRQPQVSPTEASLLCDSQSSTSFVRIQGHASIYLQSPCGSRCACDCHLVRSFKTSSVLHNIIGSLFVGYSGNPVYISQRCTDTSCMSQYTFRTCVNYQFPAWFLSRAFTATLTRVSFGEMDVALSMRRIVPQGSELFRLTEMDDIESIKELFRHGLASPNDITMAGITALNHAIQLRNFKVCELLLKAGASPHLPALNEWNVSAYDFAWDIIFRGIGDLSELETLRRLFPLNEAWWEEQGLSQLHKAVLNIIHCDLEQFVAARKLVIDSKDSSGLTALAWAIRRGDRTASKILINAGADTNVKSKSGDSALHFAARSSDLECVDLLLKAGADPRQQNGMGDSILHSKGYTGTFNAVVVQRLIDAGADPNAKNQYGASPLHASAAYNGVESAETLIRNGANINHMDDDGDSILLQSVFNTADDVTHLLLSRGASYTCWDSMGNSILHLAALSGSSRTIEILHNAKLHGVDPDAVNRQGQTVLQAALARKSKPDDFLQKLQELLADIRIRNADLSRVEAQTRDKGPKSRYLSVSDRLQVRGRARFPYQVQHTLGTIAPVTRDILVKSTLFALPLALIYFGVLYTGAAPSAGRLVRLLAYIWCLVGPGDFVEP